MTNIEIMMKHCSDNGLLNINLGTAILKAMEEYKEQEIAKLNKHDVSNSVCLHDWSRTADDFDLTVYCRKCGKKG